MKKVVKGLIYNTEKSTELCSYEYGNGFGDSHHEYTTLYVSKGGRFFISGVGGPKSRWGRQTSPNTWSSGEGLEQLDKDEAQRLCKQWGASVEDMKCYFAVEEA